MKIETKLGALEAAIIDSNEYPGISIGLWYNGRFIEYGWIEVDQTEFATEPVLKVHVFNSTEDEPVFDLDQTEDDIKKFILQGE